jgi:hypothetical protein
MAFPAVPNPTVFRVYDLTVFRVYYPTGFRVC